MLIQLDETVTQAISPSSPRPNDSMPARRDSPPSRRCGYGRGAAGACGQARRCRGERSAVERAPAVRFARQARLGQKDQLRQRISQLGEQVSGSPRSRTPRIRNALIEQELAGVRDLWQKNLVQLNRLTSLERDAAKIEGERGQIVARPPKPRQITETELQIIQIDQDLASDVAKNWRETRQDRRICRTQGDGRGSAQAHDIARRRTASCFSRRRIRSAASSPQAIRLC